MCLLKWWNDHISWLGRCWSCAFDVDRYVVHLHSYFTTDHCHTGVDRFVIDPCQEWGVGSENRLGYSCQLWQATKTLYFISNGAQVHLPSHSIVVFFLSLTYNMSVFLFWHLCSLYIHNFLLIFLERKEACWREMIYLTLWPWIKFNRKLFNAALSLSLQLKSLIM